MAHRRRIYSNYRPSNNGTISVTFAWNSLVGAYDLKFDNIYGDANWTKIKGIAKWITTTFPYGERDWDDENKIWTIHEKYFNSIKMVLNGLGTPFNVVIVEKPSGSPSVKFTPLEIYFKIFESSSGEDISKYAVDDFTKAKKIYFRTSMKIHPDKGGNPELMSEFNEAWQTIKERYFHVKTNQGQLE